MSGTKFVATINCLKLNGKPHFWPAQTIKTSRCDRLLYVFRMNTDYVPKQHLTDRSSVMDTEFVHYELGIDFCL